MERRKKRRKLDANSYDKSWDRIQLTGAWAPQEGSLTAQNYREMERQKDKYKFYERAIEAAVKNDIAGGKKLSKYKVLEVGAGFGGIAMTCLRVFKRLQIPVLYTCVEKNPLAVTTLRKKATSLSTWKGNVRVFEMDVRDWVEKWLAGDRNVHEEELAEAPPLFDMLLSELLGGFGCNELSPECLLPVERVIKPGGHCIPFSYSSYIMPVHCPALKYAVSKKAKAGVAHAFEVPWVLALPRTLSPPVALSPPQCVWKFKHRPSVATVPTSPASPALRLNRDRMLNFADERQKRRRRSKRIQSKEDEHAVSNFQEGDSDVSGLECHGFIGYFDCELFGDVKFSIIPGEDNQCLEWDPLFFPLRPPLIEAGGRDSLGTARSSHLPLQVQFRRNSSDVAWYSWLVNKGEEHNKDGQGHSMGLGI